MANVYNDVEDDKTHDASQAPAPVIGAAHW